MNKRVVIKVDQQRVGDFLTVDEFLAVQSGDLKAIINMVTFCLWDEDSHNFYPSDLAKKYIGTMTLSELLQLGKSVHQAMEDQAVDPNSGGG